MAAYDQLVDAGFSPLAAQAIGGSAALTSSIDQLNNLSFDTTAGAGGNSFTAHFAGGGIFETFSGSTPGLSVLTNLGRVSSSLESFMNDIHFGEIAMGVQFLLGPAAAAKGLIGGLVGQATIGGYVDQAKGYLSSKIVQTASGVDGATLNNILTSGAGIAASDAQHLSEIRSGYADAMQGASFAVSTR